MKALHLTELAAHVVAWHNRHPLARRISVVHVHSMGVVVLPFVAPAAAAAAGAARATPARPAPPPTEQVAPDPAQGATLRERAMAKARQQAAAAPAAAAAARVSPATAPAGKLEPVFSEHLLPPLTPAQVAAWTLKHGAPLPAPAHDAPVRQVETDDGVDTARLTRLWVLTAQIDVGKRRVRLLIGADAAAHVLGARLWSPRRLAVTATLAALLAASLAASVAAALAAAGTAALKRPARPDAAVATRTAGAASTAVAPSATPSAPASAGSAAPARAVATAAASAAALPAGMPADVEATLGRVALPSLGPRIDRRRQAARLAAGESEPPAAPPPAPTPAAPPAPAPAVAVAAVAASAAAASAPVAAPVAAQPPNAPASKASNFALSTRLLRTRSESQQVAAGLRAVLVTPQAPHMQVQVLPMGEDFRVLAWPYSQRVEAEKMRTRLAARGLKVEVVDF